MAATDLFAASGIALALCAAWLRIYCRLSGHNRTKPTSVTAITLAVFVLLLLPMPGVGIALAAFLRGFSADLSITLIALCALSLLRSLRGATTVNQREFIVLMGVVAAAAGLLYPAALGWGNWDPYRLGWGAGWGCWLFLFVLAAVCAISVLSGLRVLPAFVALALLAWSLGLMESTNLWDYLLDPWLSVFALGFVFIKCVRVAFSFWR